MTMAAARLRKRRFSDEELFVLIREFQNRKQLLTGSFGGTVTAESKRNA